MVIFTVLLLVAAGKMFQFGKRVGGKRFCFPVLCFIDQHRFVRDLAGLPRLRELLSGSLGLADAVRDHRDSSLEPQPGGKENRPKRQLGNDSQRSLEWRSIMSKVLLQRTCGLFWEPSDIVLVVRFGCNSLLKEP